MSNLQTVLDFFSAEDTAQCERRIYKYTDCGAWIAFKEGGIEIGSIVEGCDVGTQVYPLRYADNFTAKDIQDRINAVEAEASALWQWANEGPEDSDETWADLGMDAPDVWTDFQHLNPQR